LPDGSINLMTWLSRSATWASGLVDRNRDRLLEARGGTDAVGIPVLAVAGEGADIAIRRHDADGMVAAIAHIDVALRIDREAMRSVELSHLATAVSQAGLTAP
jgi:hypothetical protein